MAIKIYLNTATSYKELETIDELKITNVLNDHGYLYLTAIINEEVKTKYVTEVNNFETVEIAVVEDDKTETIFKGFVKEATIHLVKGNYLLFVTAVTGSYECDLELKSKSFQNKNMTYEDMLKTVIKEHKGGDLIDNATKGELLGKFTMMYKETTFQFIKRIASRFNASVLPSLIHDTAKLTIGVPRGTDRGEIEKYNFYITKDLERYMISSRNENKNLSELDTITFNIEIYENFDIGDKMTYYDQVSERPYVNLYIKSKEIEMVNGTLRFRYGLCTYKGLSTDPIYNEKIVGLSLKGEVIRSVKDKIKVKLEIDEKQDESTAWEFPYTSVYTAEGSSGWYFMPEAGDTVLIYFPNRNEENGVGVNSIRVKNTGTDKIGTPSIKYIRTKDGKEIKLAPDELVLTCSNWVNKETGYEQKIYIDLNDQGGITIQSTKPININSDADINFTADKKILMAAENEIMLRCKSSQIKMGKEISVVSSLVRVN